VCFCFERERDCILIVPMSDGDLRVAGALVGRPTPLEGSAAIEFGGASVTATVLSYTAEESEPTSELPTRETVSSHMKRLPGDMDPTWVATAAVKIEAYAAPPLATAPPRGIEDVAALPTEVMPVFEFWDEETRNSHALPVLLGDPAVSTQDTTSFDLAALNVSVPPLDLGEPARRQLEHAILRPPRQLRRPVLGLVARLGFIAARRPYRVAGIALAAAFTLVFVMLGLRRLASAKRTAAPTTVASVVAATASAPQQSPGPTRGPEAAAPERRTLPQSGSPESANSPSTPQVVPAAAAASPRAHVVAQGALPADSDALSALKYVVDGRDADALRVYSALSARSPNNAAYRALVRLLQRREQEACDKLAAMPAPCPDIKR
jgi:hypothetical protein